MNLFLKSKPNSFCPQLNDLLRRNPVRDKMSWVAIVNTNSFCFEEFLQLPKNDGTIDLTILDRKWSRAGAFLKRNAPAIEVQVRLAKISLG